MRSFKAVVIFLSILLHVLCENPTVTINNGKVMGISNTTIEKNTTYYAFRGIPFAKPPINSLRFKGPEKPDRWNGTLDGTVDGEDCLQLSNNTVIGSENCLFINVYTPDLNMNGSLAVMIWVYGGSFMTNSGSYKNFRPDYFLDEGVIYVSFNYRLGALGWLSTEDAKSPGNYGLKDQILALEWVQENIVHFGGDPENVTIFGESAGSASVAYLLQSNSTEGLFKAAIMESGTSLNLWAYQTNAKKHAFQLGLALGIVSTDTETLIDALRDLDGAAITTAQETVFYTVFLNDALAGLPWGPVSEPWSNESAFSGHSHEHLARGSFRRVPMIVGYNSDELGEVYHYLPELAIVFARLDLDLGKLAPYDLTDDYPKQLAAGYTIRQHYVGLHGSLAAQPTAVVPLACNDQFNRPIREFVNLASQYTDVYYYRFAYVGELGGDVDSRAYWGVKHAEELNYLFVSDNNGTEKDIVVRKRMVRLWTNFAKYSAPYYSTCDSLFSTNATSRWLPARVNSTISITNSTVDASSGLYYLDITGSLLMASNPNQTDWEFYKNEIYGVYGDGDYTTY